MYSCTTSGTQWHEYIGDLFAVAQELCSSILSYSRRRRHKHARHYTLPSQQPATTDIMAQRAVATERTKQEATGLEDGWVHAGLEPVVAASKCSRVNLDLETIVNCSGDR